VSEIGMQRIADYETELLNYASRKLLEIENMRIIGTAKHKSAVVSFLVGDIHPYDIGMLLDKLGIAVRTGHHCAQPLIDSMSIPGTVRASFAFYNSKEEIDQFINALKKVVAMLS
jgi:cysteine desulfurase/selenocysteine lyase